MRVSNKSVDTSPATICDEYNIEVRVNAKNEGGDEWNEVYQCILLGLWEALRLSALCGMGDRRR